MVQPDAASPDAASPDSASPDAMPDAASPDAIAASPDARSVPPSTPCITMLPMSAEDKVKSLEKRLTWAIDQIHTLVAKVDYLESEHEAEMQRRSDWGDLMAEQREARELEEQSRDMKGYDSSTSSEQRQRAKKDKKFFKKDNQFMAKKDLKAKKDNQFMAASAEAEMSD